MIIGVAEPSSAETGEQRKANLDTMNAALSVLEKAVVSDRYRAIMDISLTVINACEATLVLGESPVLQKSFPGRIKKPACIL